MWTKRDIITEAFAELSLAGYEFDIQPEEEQTALRRLDTMMATWEARGIRLGYALPASPDDSDPDQDSGLPDGATEAVYLNLAVRLAPGFGKVLAGDTRKAARDAFEPLLWAAAAPREQQLPQVLPRGAGNKALRRTGNPFNPPPDGSPLRAAGNGDLDILE